MIGLATRALSIADEPGDDEDLRLRKRMGVAAGYLTIVAPLTLPLIAQFHPVAAITGLSLSVFSAINLVVLTRTHRFERFVLALISAGSIFVPIATWFGGGITLTSAGIVWAFLVPSYALLALGPSRVRTWYWTFIGIVIVAIALELAFGRPFPPDPLEIQLVGAVVNTVAPLTIVFGLILYGDRRRRAAEARSEELLTNAIPATIARRLKRGEDRIADIYPERRSCSRISWGLRPGHAARGDARRGRARRAVHAASTGSWPMAGWKDQDDRRLVHGGEPAPRSRTPTTRARRWRSRGDARERR